MRKVFLATVAIVATGLVSVGSAHAQLATYDAAAFANTLHEVQNGLNQITQLNQQLTTMRQQYSMFTNPTNVTGMLPGLNTAFTQNPMPAANSIAGQVTGSPNTLSSYGQTFYNLNHVYTATGSDQQASLLNRSATSNANIQGMAAANLASIEQRQSNLNAMQDELTNASDIKQVTAINGRIAIESNAIQGQQAQAQNLQALASAQAQSDQQGAMQSIRQGHEAAAQTFTGTLN